MRYIFFLLFLFCTGLANAKGWESDSTDYSLASFPIYREMGEQIKQQKGYEQTVYWKRHKRLKRYAYSALGLGVCGTAVGWIGSVGNNAHTNSNWKEDGKVWDAVLCVGLGLTISSIPLFVISHKNKRKAKETVEFSLKSSSIHLTLPDGTGQTQQALGVCVTF